MNRRHDKQKRKSVRLNSKTVDIIYTYDGLNQRGKK